MDHNMILSASGWRKIFAETMNEEDSTPHIGEDNKILCALAGQTFAEYIREKTRTENPKVVVARDTRPTGKEISEIIIYALSTCGIDVVFIDVASAPEIMAFAKNYDGFLYISASHNPIGHNGIKFGLNDGGVVPGEEAAVLKKSFEAKCADEDAALHAKELILGTSQKEYDEIIRNLRKNKKSSLKAYASFIKEVITSKEEGSQQKKILSFLKKSCAKKLSIVCDMNGSARCVSIDKKFIPSNKIKLHAFNDIAGEIKHAIIPEPENLVHCSAYMEKLHKDGIKDALLGYMPDCDGDRGNIVFWNEEKQKAEILMAQEVFALCVLSELCFEHWKNARNVSGKKLAVAVNCPTSMRIDEICRCLKADLFRAEVGEANVVNLAREKRNDGYNVRIFGEGSNGGNITFPSAVRDPLASIFALIKLLSIRDTKKQKGLFHIWCEMSGQENLYKENFTLKDIIRTLPAYVTTGVSENRAVLKVKSEDKGLLKEKFRSVFEKSFEEKKEEFKNKYGIDSWECVTTNGTKETQKAENWNNGNGGLKIKFYSTTDEPLAFIWMRPSGTEPVFRVMCDVKGTNAEEEKELLAWETQMINQADEQ